MKNSQFKNLIIDVAKDYLFSLHSILYEFTCFPKWILLKRKQFSIDKKVINNNCQNTLALSIIEIVTIRSFSLVSVYFIVKKVIKHLDWVSILVSIRIICAIKSFIKEKQEICVSLYRFLNSIRSKNQFSKKENLHLID